MYVNFLWVGKTKNSPIRSLQEDYLSRLRHLVSCRVVEIRDVSRGRSRGSGEVLSAERAGIARFLPAGGRFVALVEGGTEVTSMEFAHWIQSEQNRGARELTFVIGGPDGLSPELCESAHFKLSLGKMTWTHEMCRVLLVEQVYRAFSILRDIPYHK